jgi:hypothetical protein
MKIRFTDLSFGRERKPWPTSFAGDEKLFKKTVQAVVELEDCYGINAECVAEMLRHDHPRLAAKYGLPEMQRMATVILASEIPRLSAAFRSLFRNFNREYFAERLPLYDVRVVFDIETFAVEPVEPGRVFDGLIRVGEQCIYIRYTDKASMDHAIIHEMAHAATNDDHDEEWLNEMVRLKNAGAPIPDGALAVYAPIAVDTVSASCP